MSPIEPVLSKRRIFISSTSKDLQAERRGLIQALSKMSYVDVAAMESFGARPDRPLAECLEEVRKSHVYVGIFASRYGFIPEGESVSITEAEYREAFRIGLPCLIFLASKESADDSVGAAAKLAALKKILMNNHICAWYETHADLMTEVLIAAHNLLVSKKRPSEEPLTGMERLRTLVAALYTDEEFHYLCLDLGVPYKDLPGLDHIAKTRELIYKLRRGAKLSSLRRFLLRDHPEIAWERIFVAAQEEWLEIKWREGIWRRFVTLPWWERIAKALSVAAVIAVAGYNALPERLQERLKQGTVWPGRHEFKVQFVDDFTLTGSGWARLQSWSRTGEPPGLKRDIPSGILPSPENANKGALLIKPGTELFLTEFAPESIYDCDIELVLSILEGKKVSWMLRSQTKKPGDGYLVELESVSGQLNIEFSRVEDGEKGGTIQAPVAVGSCCAADDVLDVIMTVRRHDFGFIVRVDSTHNPNNTAVNAPLPKVSFSDFKFRYGTIGLLETDPHGSMLVKSVVIAEPGDLSSEKSK